MKTLALRSLCIASLILSGLIVLHSIGLSKPTDKKKTGKSCLYCHQRYGNKDLTEAGQYYKQNGTLEGYKEK
jgi:hypothetical protein